MTAISVARKTMTMIENQTNQKKPNPGRGGVRPGSGRPKGSMTEARRATLKAEAQLKELARQHTAEAVETLVALMNDTSTPPAARVAAIKEILDRGHGKATQVVAGDPDNPLVVQQIAFKVIDPRH